MPDRITALIDEIAELVVLAEPSDPASLEALADKVAELRKSSGGVLRDIAEEAVELLGELTSGTAAEAHTALRLMGQYVDKMRTEIRKRSDEVPGGLDDDELIREFVVKAGEYLDSAEETLLAMERGEADADAVSSVFRAFHTIKGMTGFLSLDGLRDLAHAGESVLEPARDSGMPLDQDSIDAAVGAIDEMRLAIGVLSEGRSAYESRPGDAVGPGDDASAAATAGKARSAAALASRAVERESVRVDAERLDQLLDAIGELVIAESMASRTARVEVGASALLEQQLGRLDKLTRQLHEMAASLRMVPLRPTFNRLARAVRDLARQSGKRIDFVVSGEETELDKAAVDLIADSLLHLVRNAVDHGIESDAEERVSSGKPGVGRIELRAYHKAGNIYVEVADDGRGLPRDAIAAKARELGLLAEDQQLTDRDLFGVIARPGFSTAEKVTDVSGRGVGMDVVKRTVDSLGGQVSVRSEEGRGCAFLIRMPVTLAVIDGMTVRVGPERYIVPTLSVVRSLRPERASVSSVLGGDEVLELDEDLLRLVRLSRVLDCGAEDVGPCESIVMVVEDDGRRVGLVIDEILGQQQIVIKSLGDALGEVTGVSGGAVMPDGRVGLILDVEGLVALADEA